MSGKNIDSDNQTVKNILGEHPATGSFGSYTKAEDETTDSKIPHRSLVLQEDSRQKTVAQIRSAIISHHVSPEMINRDQRKIKNLIKQGYPVSTAGVCRFPKNDKTRKGNLAEIFLAEYLGAATSAKLPVYRLHHNPNVDQSMKGDDILAFDFTSKHPRIIVGETKFRKTPSKDSVEDIVSCLVRSHQAGLPTSLQFVADILYRENKNELADRISDCALHMAEGRLDLSYIGLLLSTENSRYNVNQHTKSTLTNLIMISFGVGDPEELVRDCFENIEEDAYANSK